MKADKSYNERLIAFYQCNIYSAQTDLELIRKNDFFKHYEMQSSDHVTYLLIDDDDRIQGMATLLFKTAWIEGEQQVIGLASDLLVSKNRKAIVNWTKFFLPAINKEKKKRKCNFIFTFISKKQTKAYHAFIRPRKTGVEMPRYFLYRRYQLNCIHGLLPFADKKLPALTFRNAEYSDREKLHTYLNFNNSKMPIRFTDSSTEIQERIYNWPYLGFEDFVLALDYQNKIVGCVAPWSNPSLEVRINKYSNNLARSTKQSLKVLSWLGMSHPLPNENEVLPVTYLTHFQADNPDIFYSLLLHSYENSHKKDLLVYHHFEGHLNTMAPKDFMSSKMDYGLYCMLSPEDPVPKFLKPSPYKDPPDFESPFLF